MSNQQRDSYEQWILARVPADLALAIAFTLAASILLLSSAVSHPIVRYVASVPIFIFLPGYSIVSALFPEKKVERDKSETQESIESPLLRRTITPLERFAFSVGVSILLVPFLGLVLNIVFPPLTTVRIVLSLATVTITGAVLAGKHRRTVPPERRFKVPYRNWINATLYPEQRKELVYNALVLISIVSLVGSFAYATTVPSETYTEFAVLSEDESGELVADGYPTGLARGETGKFHLLVQNHEQDDMRYTVVVQLQEVGSEGEIILRSKKLRQFQLRVQSGETKQMVHSFTPQKTGRNLRLTYLLYHNAPPKEPTQTNSYEYLHIWVNVTS